MTKVSRRFLPQNLERGLLSDFWFAIRQLDDRERVFFLDKILTPTEKVMLAKRLAIIKDLAKGGTYHEISEKHKVISYTIARMSELLRASTVDLLPILRKIDRTIPR